MVELVRPRLALAAVLASILAALSPTAPAGAEELRHGDDLYLAGDDVETAGSVGRNLYLAGGSVDLRDAVLRDAHVAGFKVDVEAPVGGDLYAAGAFVDLGAPVAGDASAAGFRVAAKDGAAIEGNLRAFARSVVLDGNVAGAALVAAERLQLRGTVAGDLRFTGRSLSFGPDARVGGMLTAAMPFEPRVPTSVAPADRVRHEPFRPFDFAHDFGRRAMEGAGEAMRMELPPWWLVAGVAAGGLVVLVLVGVLFLGLAPETIEALRESAESRMWRSFFYGLIGLATLLGLVPLAVVTVVGLPLIPLILMLAVLLTVFAWLLGAYVLAHRVLRSFGAGHATMAGRLRTFVIGAIVLMALNLVPVLGWLINAFGTLVGFGALQMRLVQRLDRPAPAQYADPPGAARSR